MSIIRPKRVPIGERLAATVGSDGAAFRRGIADPRMTIRWL